MNGAIYVVGGFDGGNYLASVERFDPRVSFYPFTKLTNNFYRKESGVV